MVVGKSFKCDKGITNLCELVWTVVLVIAVVMQGRHSQQEYCIANGDHVKWGPPKVLCVKVELNVTTASGKPNKSDA